MTCICGTPAPFTRTQRGVSPSGDISVGCCQTLFSITTERTSKINVARESTCKASFVILTSISTCHMTMVASTSPRHCVFDLISPDNQLLRRLRSQLPPSIREDVCRCFSVVLHVWLNRARAFSGTPGSARSDVSATSCNYKAQESPDASPDVMPRTRAKTIASQQKPPP
jgi:hypothetical protein